MQDPIVDNTGSIDPRDGYRIEVFDAPWDEFLCVKLKLVQGGKVIGSPETISSWKDNTYHRGKTEITRLLPFYEAMARFITTGGDVHMLHALATHFVNALGEMPLVRPEDGWELLLTVNESTWQHIYANKVTGDTLIVTEDEFVETSMTLEQILQWVRDSEGKMLFDDGATQVPLDQFGSETEEKD